MGSSDPSSASAREAREASTVPAKQNSFTRVRQDGSTRSHRFEYTKTMERVERKEVVRLIWLRGGSRDSKVGAPGSFGVGWKSLMTELLDIISTA